MSTYPIRHTVAVLWTHHGCWSLSTAHCYALTFVKCRVLCGLFCSLFSAYAYSRLPNSCWSKIFGQRVDDRSWCRDGEISRNTFCKLSAHFLSVVLNFAPLRSPWQVHYDFSAYLVLACLIKHTLPVKCMVFSQAHTSLLPEGISPCT